MAFKIHWDWESWTNSLFRVGDLQSLDNTFITPDDIDKIAEFDDILVAFDGPPGRNNIGLIGAYSSGIYNLKCSEENKGLVYFEINSKINRKIIDDHSQGTTILHASKSINYLDMLISTIMKNNY